MRLSVQTDFALRVLIYLGADSANERSRVQEIADAYDISHNHLTKVVQQLHRTGYVHTHRGKGGGVSLAQPVSSIKVGAVVREFESAKHLVECFSPGNQCVITSACQLKHAFAAAYEAFVASLDQHSLSDLIDDSATELRRLLLHS